MTNTKQTAANNAFLIRVKHTMNTPIFKKVSEIYNASGEPAAIEYLRKFFTVEAQPRMIAKFTGIAE